MFKILPCSLILIQLSVSFGKCSELAMLELNNQLSSQGIIPFFYDSIPQKRDYWQANKIKSDTLEELRSDRQPCYNNSSIPKLDSVGTLLLSKNKLSLDSVKIEDKRQKSMDKTVVLLGMTQVPELPLRDLPTVNTSNVDILDVKLEGIPSVDPMRDQELNVTIPKYYPIPEGSLSSVDNLQEVVNVKEVSDKVSVHQKDAQELKENLGRLKEPQNLEKRLSETEVMGDVKEHISEADRLKRYSDPEVAREEAVNKAKEEVVNHFAGHGEELKAAMQKLSDLKSKFHDTDGVLDLFAKRQRPLKGKPFIERFIPGLSFQFQKQESFWLDVAPQVVFIVSRRFSTGIAWNERLAYDFDRNNWDRKNHIYGIRNFVNFKLKENLFVRAEVEAMNAPLRVSPVNVEIIGRGWVWSYFGGIKKDFQFSKTLKANVQMLYNLYDPEKDSPYTNRFNVRLGLELPLKGNKPVEVN